MKLILKEAMRSAEDGCLMDKEEITRVLYRLLETPAKEFPKEYISSLKEMLSCGLEWIENVSDEEFGEYTYLDLLCLTDITAYSLIVEDYCNYQTPKTGNCTTGLAESILEMLAALPNHTPNFDDGNYYFNTESQIRFEREMQELRKKRRKKKRAG